jgi:indolepyruvate ferredoxin oxidoreductase
VFKHANMAGTTPWGGVIAIAGDDHVAKSSTAAHQSDHVFKAVGFPTFFPATVQEILDLGLHAFAMSRYSGVWAGMKTIQEIVESSTSAMIDPERVDIKIPTDFEMPPGGLHIRWPDAPLEQEARLMDYKWYAALAYIRANRLNYNVVESKHDRLGLIASGKAYNDMRQALMDLGLDDDACQRLGVRVHKVGVVWPLEAQITREFASGLKEILVIEEKRQVIEYQLKEELYNWRADVRPNVLGKFEDLEGDMSGGEWSMPNPTANTFLRANADLSPAIIAKAIAKRLKKLGVDSDTARRMDERLQIIEGKERHMAEIDTKGDRTPWFCSGCPHNTSTKVPEGSRAMAGIGCHYMVNWMDRSTFGFTQMGGEGVPWVGQAPFTGEKHIFTNLGDGTYFHSGILAIRQCIAAGVNITFKILYNDAVAMTGGQQVGERPEGHSVIQIAHSLAAEGVSKLIVVSDQPEKYNAGVVLPPGVTVHHRDEMDLLQEQFRQIAGTSIIIYDQTCATEKRRRRKRGKMAQSEARVVINEAVCEGCGDCSVQSNCLSVEPLETEFGRKRQINQSSCNTDFSCVKGFCPSFVSVQGTPKKKAKDKAASPFDDALFGGPLPMPTVPAALGAYGIVVAGVGGTGVITVGQILGVAAHLEGKGIVTQDAAGLAQKGGNTWSHVQISDDGTQGVGGIRCTRVSTGDADLILGCDPIVAANKESVLRMRAGKTRVALNANAAPNAQFVTTSTQWSNPAGQCVSAVQQVVGNDSVGLFNADAAAAKLMGDGIYTNPMMMGFAWQKGWIPLQLESLMRAFELNGVQIDNNKAAFTWGRRAAMDWASVEKLLTPAQVIQFKKPETLEAVIERRVAFLTDYQDAAYAKQYADFVAQVRDAEGKVLEGKTSLTDAVARGLFKLMAYKDEYEVARLHSQSAFADKLAAQFEPGFKLNYHLAPPLLSKKNHKGELVKTKYGAWMGSAFKVLAKFKGLRGGALDVFGYTAERRMERALIGEYKTAIGQTLASLTSTNHTQAVELARSADNIRGFGHVKERNVAAVRGKWNLV